MDGVSDKLYAAAALPLGKEAPLPTQQGGRDRRANLDALEKR
jgi:hypothetical protein